MTSVTTDATDTLKVLFEDESIYVIHKPYGVPFHSTDDEQGIVQAAKLFFNNTEIYPVHRLDKPTSGLLLFTLDKDTAKHVSQQFEQQLISKEYLAVVRGFTPPEGIIDYPLKEIAVFKHLEKNVEQKEAVIEDLNDGDIELLAMTSHANIFDDEQYPPHYFYVEWIKEAYQHNANTKFLITVPHVSKGELNSDQYQNENYDFALRTYIEALIPTKKYFENNQNLYPGVEIYFLAYGNVLADLWVDFESSEGLTGVENLVAQEACEADFAPDQCNSFNELTDKGYNQVSVFRDRGGHGGTISDHSIGLLWFSFLYEQDISNYTNQGIDWATYYSDDEINEVVTNGFNVNVDIFGPH